MKLNLFKKSSKNVSASSPSILSVCEKKFSQTDDGLDAETFLLDFFTILNFTFASFGNFSHHRDKNHHKRKWKTSSQDS